MNAKKSGSRLDCSVRGRGSVISMVSRTTLPGPADKSDLLDYHYARGRSLTAVEGLKALDGYVYQSCEHPDWEKSEAYRWVERLRDALIRFLPGYAEADTWSISDTER